MWNYRSGQTWELWDGEQWAGSSGKWWLKWNQTMEAQIVEQSTATKNLFPIFFVLTGTLYFLIQDFYWNSTSRGFKLLVIILPDWLINRVFKIKNFSSRLL